MAGKAGRLPYRSDQRTMTFFVATTADGRTSCSLVWKEALAGETDCRITELGRWKWARPINTQADAIACLVWVARRMADQADPTGP